MKGLPYLRGGFVAPVPTRFSSLEVCNAPTSDLGEMLPDSCKYFHPLAICEFLLEFAEGKVHDVVVMQFFGAQPTAELQPDGMKKVNLRGCQPGRMRPQASSAESCAAAHYSAVLSGDDRHPPWHIPIARVHISKM